MVDAVRWVACGAVVAGQAGGGREDDEVAFLVLFLLLLGAEAEDATGAWVVRICCAWVVRGA